MVASAGGAVFVDTAGLLALANSDDALHERARAVADELGARRALLVTSDWVLTEFLNTCAGVRRRRAGIGMVDRLRAPERIRIVPATRRGWTAAFDLYRSRPDKEWSLVDCSSMLVCEARGIRRVFTHDAHFAQAGFEVLLR